MQLDDNEECRWNDLVHFQRKCANHILASSVKGKLQRSSKEKKTSRKRQRKQRCENSGNELSYANDERISLIQKKKS